MASVRFEINAYIVLRGKTYKKLRFAMHTFKSEIDGYFRCYEAQKSQIESAVTLARTFGRNDIADNCQEIIDTVEMAVSLSTLSEAKNGQLILGALQNILESGANSEEKKIIKSRNDEIIDEIIKMIE